MKSIFSPINILQTSDNNHSQSLAYTDVARHSKCAQTITLRKYLAIPRVHFETRQNML